MNARSIIIALSCFALTLPAIVPGGAPQWWLKRGVVGQDKQCDDFAAANQGQLKWITKLAADELNEELPSGAGDEINELIQSWQQASNADDFAVVTTGQVKRVVALFRKQLADAGEDVQPLTGGGVENFAVANIGQIKQAFAFEISRATTETQTDESDLSPAVLAMAAAPLADSSPSAVTDGIASADKDYFLGAGNGSTNLFGDDTKHESFVHDDRDRLTLVTSIKDTQGNPIRTEPFALDQEGNLKRQ